MTDTKKKSFIFEINNEIIYAFCDKKNYICNKKAFSQS
jgi:hypothetical protein